MKVNKEWIEKYNQAIPRYTSYPTVPFWKNRGDCEEEFFHKKLLNFNEKDNQKLSLYIHLPFCKKRCLFCACNVIIDKTRTYISKYIDYLEKEILLYHGLIQSKKEILQMHWGGGTPNYLSNSEIEKVYKLITQYFILDKCAEISIEIDPSYADSQQIHFLKKLGFNRISLGIQDLNPEVQASIERIQSFDHILEQITLAKQLNYDSINIDIIYGLPFQNTKIFQNTLDKILILNPDRIALYSYAHVPWIHKHQKKINENSLANPHEKFSLFLQAKEFLQNHEYLCIGFDHFSKKNDDLALAIQKKKLYRNFMGYSIQHTEDLLAFGISSISYIENCYFQNTKILKDYYQSLDNNQFPQIKFMALSERDLIIKWTIDQLMCYFEIDFQIFEEKFKIHFNSYFKNVLKNLDPFLKDQFIAINDDKLIIQPLGQAFIRNICSIFDDYLHKLSEGMRKFSKSI